MLAVIICNVCTVAMLVGLLAGIAVWFIETRVVVAAALTFDTYAAVTSRPAVRPPTRLRPA